MRYDFAPMEGVTDAIFRSTHARIFADGRADRYFTPFLSPNQNHIVDEKRGHDWRPEQNAGLNVVPQLLTKNAEDFIWMAGILRDWGYTEVNLNLGCPSGTVAAKGKGAGALRDPAALERLLDGIYAGSPLPVSLKTRLGIADASEFPAILEIYNRYPVKELIVHPRVQKQMYRGEADRAAFAAALAGSKAPVCYNGDLFTADACRALAAEYPAVSGLMLGRGLAADPALVRLARGGSGLALAELQAFADALFAEYCTAFRSEKSAINRMKALWNLWFTVFEDADELQKKMHRAAEPWAYRAAVRTAFAQGCLKAGV